jgi:hypothetical protein
MDTVPGSQPAAVSHANVGAAFELPLVPLLVSSKVILVSLITITNSLFSVTY